MITLKPARASTQKKVVWTDDTVDNEHMNKKKSKCCCIYEKPRRWDESDSETDDECEHCFGHVERRQKHKHATTTTTTEEQESVERVAMITLKPARASTQKKVVWTDDTVDNEHMNKKKSKCCCIYEKPRRWDESDSETDDECEHCFGHVERRQKHKHATTTTTTEEQSTVEKTASITLQPQPAPPDRPATDS